MAMFPMTLGDIIIIIPSVNIKQSCTAMQYSGAGQQGPRKDTDSCPKKKHDMAVITINQHYK